MEPDLVALSQKFIDRIVAASPGLWVADWDDKELGEPYDRDLVRVGWNRQHSDRAHCTQIGDTCPGRSLVPTS